jgi:hypothetical protein
MQENTHSTLRVFSLISLCSRLDGSTGRFTYTIFNIRYARNYSTCDSLPR